jgi:DNA-binding MarR family transcriptional regulator
MTGGPGTEAGSALRLAVLRLSRRLRQETAGSGDVTPSQMSALVVLSRNGELTLGELAAIERIAPPSMTRIAGRLEDKGLLERRADASDRRVARVAISPSGEELLRQSREKGDAFVTARLAQLTEVEQEVLARAVPLLERLASDDPSPKPKPAPPADPVANPGVPNSHPAARG